MTLFKRILIFLIRLYQCLLSPAKVALFGLNSGCRFTPSCSNYAIEALQAYGAWRGLWLALNRFGRCHPWGGWGMDPVPAPREPQGSAEAPSAILPHPSRRRRLMQPGHSAASQTGLSRRRHSKSC